jgi:hypothetical protein
VRVFHNASCKGKIILRNPIAKHFCLFMLGLDGSTDLSRATGDKQEIAMTTEAKNTVGQALAATSRAAFYRAELAKAAPPANGSWYQPGEDGHRLCTALRLAERSAQA